uniref:Uncharacterized protein n=1 Tax=Anaerobacillus isosaccharinicus TaxID=1532552 RepID=A0A1S2M5T0_9BACI
MGWCFIFHFSSLSSSYLFLACTICLFISNLFGLKMLKSKFPLGESLFTIISIILVDAFIYFEFGDFLVRTIFELKYIFAHLSLISLNIFVIYRVI